MSVNRGSLFFVHSLLYYLVSLMNHNNFSHCYIFILGTVDERKATAMRIAKCAIKLVHWSQQRRYALL